jgi:NAD(P)-dependent dehydrogenase (short-subunit alcohol dehydrogenase family)
MSEQQALATADQVLLIGGSSVIAHALARCYATDGWTVIFGGRDEVELSHAATDVAIRHGTATRTLHFDAAAPASVDAAAASLIAAGPLPRDLIFVIGYSDGADRAPYDPVQSDRIYAANYGAVARFLARLLPQIAASSGHRIVFVSSVAGDRGRKTNFVYGAAKAALNTYAQGLRALLLRYGTSVLTIKLGYVDTRLAYGKTPSLLTCSPAYAARSIRKALQRKAMVVYLPWIWRPIMTLLRHLPEAVFIRLPLP